MCVGFLFFNVILDSVSSGNVGSALASKPNNELYLKPFKTFVYKFGFCLFAVHTYDHYGKHYYQTISANDKH